MSPGGCSRDWVHVLSQAVMSLCSIMSHTSPPHPPACPGQRRRSVQPEQQPPCGHQQQRQQPAPIGYGRGQQSAAGGPGGEAQSHAHPQRAGRRRRQRLHLAPQAVLRFLGHAAGGPVWRGGRGRGEAGAVWEGRGGGSFHPQQGAQRQRWPVLGPAWTPAPPPHWQEDGPIDAPKTVADVRKEPITLPER